MPSVPPGPDKPRDPIEEVVRGMLQRMGSPVPAEQIMADIRIEAMGRGGRSAEQAILVYTGGNPVFNVLIGIAIAENHIQTTGHRRAGRQSTSIESDICDVYTAIGPEGPYQLWIRYMASEAD